MGAVLAARLWSDSIRLVKQERGDAHEGASLLAKGLVPNGRSARDFGPFHAGSGACDLEIALSLTKVLFRFLQDFLEPGQVEDGLGRRIV